MLVFRLNCFTLVILWSFTKLTMLYWFCFWLKAVQWPIVVNFYVNWSLVEIIISLSISLHLGEKQGLLLIPKTIWCDTSNVAGGDLHICCKLQSIHIWLKNFMSNIYFFFGNFDVEHLILTIIFFTFNTPVKQLTH